MTLAERLQELDKEWDIERAIEAEVAGSVLLGFVFGATLSKKWFLLPAFAGAMLLLHTIRGEYPLLPLFRRLGFRTANEIAQERYALKALRGDFDNIDPGRAQDHASDTAPAALRMSMPERVHPGAIVPRHEVSHSFESVHHPRPDRTSDRRTRIYHTHPLPTRSLTRHAEAVTAITLTILAGDPRS